MWTSFINSETPRAPVAAAGSRRSLPPIDHDLAPLLALSLPWEAWTIRLDTARQQQTPLLSPEISDDGRLDRRRLLSTAAALGLPVARRR